MYRLENGTLHRHAGELNLVAILAQISGTRHGRTASRIGGLVSYSLSD